VRGILGTSVLAAGLVAGSAAAWGADRDPTFKVLLERGPCFGSCPVYSVQVDAEGHVVWHGRRSTAGISVACQGERRWRVGADAVAKLEAQVDGSGFFQFADAYRGRVTDLPTYTVTVTRRGRTKTVVDYAGGTVGMPAEMTTLELAIDDQAGAIRCIDPPH